MRRRSVWLARSIAGARAATGEWLVVMDADLSHPPEKIAELLRPLMERPSRYRDRQPLRRRAARRPAGRFGARPCPASAAALAYPLTGVHDSMCGFFAMPRKLLLELTAAATGFKIAFEVLVQGGKESAGDRSPHRLSRSGPRRFQDEFRRGACFRSSLGGRDGENGFSPKSGNASRSFQSPKLRSPVPRKAATWRTARCRRFAP